jgi:ATP-binding cassette, subfamily G (WHITE), member 2, PDR
MLPPASIFQRCSILCHLFSVGKSKAIIPRANLITDYFHSVLVNPGALPRFWIFMYRVSPVTYFVSGMMSTGTAGVNVMCAAKELVILDPTNGQTCGAYLEDFLSLAGGRLLNPDETQRCQFCPVADTDTLLATLWIYFGDRWRNLGITLAYNVANIILAMCLYWAFRVPKQSPQKRQRTLATAAK